MRNNNIIITNCLLVLSTFLIVSCEIRKEKLPLNVIPVASTVGNYKILNLSDFTTDIKYIPLETNDSVLISSIIPQVIFENEKILILSLDDGFQEQLSNRLILRASKEAGGER